MKRASFYPSSSTSSSCFSVEKVQHLVEQNEHPALSFVSGLASKLTLEVFFFSDVFLYLFFLDPLNNPHNGSRK